MFMLLSLKRLHLVLVAKVVTGKLWISDGQSVDTVRKSGYSDNQIHEENEHNRHGSFAQFCRLR
jgi:hypothetical protein